MLVAISVAGEFHETVAFHAVDKKIATTLAYFQIRESNGQSPLPTTNWALLLHR